VRTLTTAQEAGMDTEELEEYFIIERDSGEPDDEGRLTHPVNLHEISPELDEKLNAFFKAIKKVSPNKLADKRKRQETYKIVVTSALNAKTAQYCSTPQEDEALLRDGDLSKRNRMAIEVRLGERKLLDEAIALIRGPEGEDEEAEGERSKKKTRTTR
jgi:SET domain-containing protein 6